MIRSRTGILTLLATVLLGWPLSAQQTVALAPGQRVRVTAPSAGLNGTVGTVSAVRGREFVLEVERMRQQHGPFDSAYTATYSVPLDSVRSLEVSLGRHSHFWTGAGIGAVVLGVVGGVWGSESKGGMVISTGGASTLGAVAGVVVGGLLGGLVGAAVVTDDHWTRVPLGGDRIGLVVTPGGRLGLGASLAF